MPVCLFGAWAQTENLNAGSGEHSGSVSENSQLLIPFGRGPSRADIPPSLSGCASPITSPLMNRAARFAPGKRRWCVVLSQNLNPDVLMMKSTEDWYGCDAAEPLWAPQIGRILCQ